VPISKLTTSQLIVSAHTLLVLIKASRYPGCPDTRQLLLQGRLARIDQVFPRPMIPHLPRKLVIPDRVSNSVLINSVSKRQYLRIGS